MKSNNPKLGDKIISPKNHNLSELSISQIWENKFIDQSTDFQQERILINTITQCQKQMEHQYGLQINKRKQNYDKLQRQNIYEIRPRKDAENSKSISEGQNSSEKSLSLAFNKLIKRKKNYSKQKAPLHIKSAKALQITKPVPSIHQHIFKASTESKIKLSANKNTKTAKPVKISLEQQCAVSTIIYQIPIKHSKFKNDQQVDRKNYHLMVDDIKIQINDLNCELFEEPFIESTFDIYNIRTGFQQSERTIKNYKRCNQEKSVRSSQLTNLNQTQTFTQASWGQSNNTQPKIFELKRPRSYDGRHQSIFSSTKTDRVADSSPFSKESTRTTKKSEKPQNKIIISRNTGVKAENGNNFYRNNILTKNRVDSNRQHLQYFQLGYLRGSLKNFAVSP